MTAGIKCLVIFLLLHKYETLCHWKSNVLLSYMTNIPLYVFLFFVQTCLADDRGIQRITRKVPQDTSEHIGRFLTINRLSRRAKAPKSGANKENEEGQDYWTTEDEKQVTYCKQGTQFDQHLSFTRRTQSQAQNKKGGKMASTCQVRSSSSCETFILVSEINLCLLTHPWTSTCRFLHCFGDRLQPIFV